MKALIFPILSLVICSVITHNEAQAKIQWNKHIAKWIEDIKSNTNPNVKTDSETKADTTNWNINWNVESNNEKVKDTTKKVMKQWDKVIDNVSFKQSDTNANIIVKLTEDLGYSDKNRLATYGLTEGNIKEDTKVSIVIDKDIIDNDILYRLLLHEVGHSLGLEHREGKTVMSEFIESTTDYIDKDTKQLVKDLYN